MRIAIQAMEVICDECGKKELRKQWEPRNLNVSGWFMSEKGLDYCSEECKEQAEMLWVELFNLITGR